MAYAKGKSGQRAAAAETFKKYMTLAKPSDKADWQLCLYLLGDFRNRNEEFFNELGKILDDPEHKFHAEAKSLNYRVNPVAEASENLSDLFASVENNQWDGKTKGGRGGNTASEEHFEAARTEFSKPNHNNNFIKNHLLQISPSDKETFPYAQIMLAQVYFQEKDYRMAVWAYKKYASFDGSSDVQWRLLNFRLAAYPFQKDEFWDLLKKLEDDGGDFGEKAKKMRNGLKERGISN